MSKRQVSLLYGMNLKAVQSLLDFKVLLYTSKECNPLRRKIDVRSLANLKENTHYVVCRQCGKYQRKILPRHLKSCGKLNTLREYQIAYPYAPTRCTESVLNGKKTEEQKIKQSETLKARFQTSEGETTRKQISEAALKALSCPIRYEATAKQLRDLNNSPEMKARISKRSKKFWEDGGILRVAVTTWHKENKEESDRLAAHARSFLSKTSKLHLDFKDLMVASGIKGFITEAKVGYYFIDEAHLEYKIAVEVDGCYWHGCDICGIEPPNDRKASDKRKTNFLTKKGWEVIRFWGHDIRNNPEDCINTIKQSLYEKEQECL
jgi:very-short-patch-repair endonuclease